MRSDAVNMIAYRAETAMVAVLRRHLKKEDDARALIRELFVSSGDIEPDEYAQTLSIPIDHMANPAHDRATVALLHKFNQLQLHHPATVAKMTSALI